MKWLFKFVLPILLGLLLILVGARFFLSEQLGEAAFKRAAHEAMTSNPLADLEDGLHVILIGTGSPLPDPRRAGPSTAILAGNALYIVDSGGGSVRSMGELRVPAGRVEAVFLTHLHSDHIDGLGELGLQRWAGGGRDTPLQIYGPEGTQALAEGLNAGYTPDSRFRIAHHGEDVVPPGGYGMQAKTLTLAEGEDHSIALQTEGGLTVTVFRVNHDPVSPAFGYRFDYKGRSVTLSGDTAYDLRIAEIGKDTDLLIHEALNRDMVGVIENELTIAGNKRLAKIMADIPSYHASPVEAAQTAQEANAGMLIISHIVPAVPAPALYPYFLKDTDKAYDGPIVMGEDGMMFSLPANSDAIKRTRLN